MAAMALGLLLFLLSLVLLDEMVEGVRSARWPSTNGRVESHDVSHVCGRNHTMVLARPIYRYTVAGMRYRGDRIVSTVNGPCIAHVAEARRYLEQEYPIGAQVTVYFDPEQPSFAVLRGGVVSKVETGLVAAAWALALALGVGGWRTRRSARG
jgi:hypothetical protein